MTNSEIFQRAVEQLQEAEPALSASEAGTRIQKAHPGLYEDYRRAPEAPAPLSYAERVAKQEGGGSAAEVIARRVEAEIHASGTTQDKALSKVIHDEPLLWEQYRIEQQRGQVARLEG